MADIVANDGLRQPATNSRAVSPSDRLNRLPRRAVSQSMRLTATVPASVPDAIDVEILLTVMARHGITKELFAQNAGVSRTTVQEAFAKQRGRKIAFAAVLAQGAAFVADVQDETNRRLGLSLDAQRQESFDAIVAVLRSVYFRERREERTA